MTTRGGLGPQGFRGLQGIQGPTGPQGSNGLSGNVGPQGSTGLSGNVGPVGADGQGFKIFYTGDDFPILIMLPQISNLKSYYKFDTNSINGTSVANYATGVPVYDATLQNGASLNTTDYQFGNASLSLDATKNQYLSMPSMTIGNNGLSFALWFKSNNSGYLARLFSSSNGPNSNVAEAFINFYGLNILHLSHDNYTFNGVQSRLSTNNNYNNNTWTHIVWTLHPTSGWNVYINGSLIKNDTNRVYPYQITNTINTLGQSAWWESHTDAYFNGLMDEYLVYNSVLTQSDVNVLYNKQYVNMLGQYYLHTGGNLYINVGNNNGDSGPDNSYTYSGNVAGSTGPQGIQGGVGKGFVVYKSGDGPPNSAEFTEHEGEFYLKKGGDLYCYIPGTLANETTGDLTSFKYVGDVTDEAVLQGPTGPNGSPGQKGDTGANGNNGQKGDTGLSGPIGTNGYDSYAYVISNTTYNLADNTTTNKVVNVVNMTDNSIDVTNGSTTIKTLQAKYTYASFIKDTNGWNIVNM